MRGLASLLLALRDLVPSLLLILDVDFSLEPHKVVLGIPNMHPIQILCLVVAHFMEKVLGAQSGFEGFLAIFIRNQ